MPKTPEQKAYDSVLKTQHTCQCCGRDDSWHDKPDFWGAEWMMQRAHLASGSGTVKYRAKDIRAIVVLCPLCHKLHSHHGGAQVIGGFTFRGLSDGNILWLKCHRDPNNWDEEWLREWWIGALPEPVEPTFMEVMQ